MEELAQMNKLLYEKDFQKWIETTINHLQNQEFTSLDIKNLIEELQDLGKSEKRALESNLMILFAHLLKLFVQKGVPESMKLSWSRSVIEHRKRILVDLRKTPSLNNYIVHAVEQAYPDGRDLAIEEGKKASFGVRISDDFEYPIACPFTIEQILDPDFFG